MTSALAIAASAPLATLAALADEYEAGKRAASTRRAYAGAWRRFVVWCDAHGAQAFPAAPETVRRYVAGLAKRVGPRTIGVACAAIRAEHYDAGRFDPTAHPSVRGVLAGIRRAKGMAPKKKRALPIPELSRMCDACPGDAAGVRDRAILLLGFAGAFRRAALVSLDVGNVERTADGLRVYIARDKQDQEGQGRWIVVPPGEHPATCPVRAVVAWLDVLGRSAGPLFVRMRSGRRRAAGGPPRPAKLAAERLSAATVGQIVQARALAAGVDPAGLAGHSLRAGLMTASARARKRLDRIMAQSGHVKPETALGYIRDAEAGDEENAARGIGL